MFRVRMPCFDMTGDELHPLAEKLESAARSLEGVRFRPQGRSRAGCDCLGLTILVAQDAGLAMDVPAFPLRGFDLATSRGWLADLGCRERSKAQSGDLLLQSPATLQVHLAVKVGGGVVEAHAGLRRVVFRTLVAGEIWDSAWRLPLGDG